MHEPPSASPAASPRRPSRALIVLFRAPTHLYQHGWGWVFGHRFLQLTHAGRRSGRTYTTVLEVISFDASTGEATVLSGFGAGADWLRNIQANGRAEITMGRASFPATYRLVPIDEAMAVFADYERRNRFAAPVVRLVLSWMLGWRYDGSGSARRRAAEQLPSVAFRPS
ncbi:MAG: nitroreductase family deazaflavin-dependent oxidoreductase [Dermatophilaceae bacterium]